MGDRLLQDRLQAQAGGFDGLLSLIPAKMYYGEDNQQDQWKRKKQTKAEAKAARRAKLDPDSELNRNAKEVMDERANTKRKLREDEDDAYEEEEEEEGGDVEAIEGIEFEKPREGMKQKTPKPQQNKKQKLDDDNDDDEEEPAEADDQAEGSQQPKLSKKEEKRAAKQEKRREKKAEKKAKQAEKPSTTTQPSESAPETKQTEEETSEAPAADAETQEQDDDEGNDASTGESAPQSPTFDGVANGDAAADAPSTSTSVSSTVPPSEKPKHIRIPNDTSALRARLAAKIEALRAARKADGPDGKPIRTRQELIESRRAKEAQRKARKKELRTQAKVEEARKREEALASNSPTVMSPVVELGADDGMSSGNFAFGRVAFGDGTQLSHDLSYVLSKNKKKGPSDPKTALLKAQAQKKRLQELDEEKRKEVAEKETWLTARRRAEGDKVHDNEALLKRTVKRKEATKRKSEKAWKDRQRGVEMAQKEKQKKREENIRKRREDKAMGKAGKKKGGKKGASGAKKSRPGFEGSLGVGSRRK